MSLLSLEIKACHSERSEESLPASTTVGLQGSFHQTVRLAWPAAGSNSRFHRHSSRSPKRQFHESIRARPDRRQTRRPILAIDGLPRPRMFLLRQHSRRRRELSSGNPPENCARRHLHLRIIPYPLHLPHIAPRHHVELFVHFAEPNWRRHAHAALAKRSQRNIFLPANGIRNLAIHSLILTGNLNLRIRPHKRSPPASPVLPCGPQCPQPALSEVEGWLRIQDTTPHHCPRRRRCVTSLTCVNGCAIVFSAARKSLPSRPISRLLRLCSPHISTPGNRPPPPTLKKKVTRNRPFPPRTSLSLSRNPVHVPALVPCALLPLSPPMLRLSTLHPPMFPTRFLTPSTLPHPAKPLHAAVAAAVVVDAAEAEAAAANKLSLKPSPPKASHPRFRQKWKIHPKSVSPKRRPHPRCPSRRGRPPPPSRSAHPKAS